MTFSSPSTSVVSSSPSLFSSSSRAAIAPSLIRPYLRMTLTMASSTFLSMSIFSVSFSSGSSSFTGFSVSMGFSSSQRASLTSSTISQASCASSSGIASSLAFILIRKFLIDSMTLALLAILTSYSTITIFNSFIEFFNE